MANNEAYNAARGPAKDIVATGRELFTEWMDAWSDNRQKYLEDTKFVWMRGAQWPEQYAQQRRTDKRPCLEINQMPQYVRQITNDQRQNRPSIRIRPVGKGATEKLAELYSGLIRGIEYESNAAAAYDTGFECAVVGGFGAWRVCTEYLDDDSFDQVLRIRRIANPLCVVIDPMYSEADASDMMGAFVYEEMSKDEFKRRWPDAEPIDFEVETEGYKYWCDGDNITVADWFRVEIKSEKLYAVRNQTGQWEKVQGEITPEMRQALERGEKAGMVKCRTVERRTVVWRKLAGNQVLETIEWAGKFVPIIPIFGDECNIDGEKVLQGFIRRGRDPQQMYNYWSSSATERVALSPKAPFLGYKGQFKDGKWKSANEKNWAYLEAEAFIDGWPAGNPAPLPQRQTIDADASGVLGMAQAARFDLQSALGMYDASLGNKSNETSGRAIIAREKQGDTSTFHYIDNLSRAIRYTGKVLVDLIPKIYDTPRLLRVIGEDQSEKFEQVNQPNPAAAVQLPPEMAAGPPGAHPVPPGMPPSAPGTPPPGMQPGVPPAGMPQPGQLGVPGAPEPPQSDAEALNDLRVGDYDVVVDVGPSYATKRLESVEAMGEFMQADPSMVPLIGDLYAGEMDWPGARKIAERLRFRLPPAVLQAESQKDPKLAMAMAPLQQQLQQLTQQNQQLTTQLQQAGQMIQGMKLDTTAKMAKAQSDMAKAQGEQQLQPLKVQAEQTKADAASEKAESDRAKAVLDAIIQLIKLQQTQATGVAQQAAAYQGTVERIYDSEQTAQERAYNTAQTADERSYDSQERAQNLAERQLAATEQAARAAGNGRDNAAPETYGPSGA